MQFVWWWNPAAWRLGVVRFYGAFGEIYKWAVILGPLEIRRWTR